MRNPNMSVKRTLIRSVLAISSVVALCALLILPPSLTTAVQLKGLQKPSIDLLAGNLGPISDDGKSIEGLTRIDLYNTNAGSTVVNLYRRGTNEYLAIFSDTIESPLDYVNLTLALAALTEKDVITLHLSGYGGRTSATFSLLNSLTNTKAKVAVQIVGNVYSAHAYISCAADELIISDEVLFMLHMSSIIRNPRVDEGTKEAHLAQETLVLKKYCSHIVSDKDIEAMANGQDVYYNADEIRSKTANQ